jgi:hypothetical protein
MTTPIDSLAKELRLDGRRLIADARIEGIQVTHTTDHIPVEVACRIRAKYRRAKTLPGLPRYRNTKSLRCGDKEEFRKLDGLTPEDIQFLFSIV